jgi:sulfide:quinone oxidoreductase
VKPRIVVLGAGFAGLEFSTTVSEELGDSVEITIIDQAESFVFGFAKLDVLFGHATAGSVQNPYRDFRKPGVTLRNDTVTAIDPAARVVTTDRGRHQADVLVIALGADYYPEATPGLVLGENEFYTLAGAERLREELAGFERGHAVVGVAHAPYKCPPAPSECALMLHDFLVKRGVRQNCSITLALPLPSPVPPSPESSRALLEAFAERNIGFIASQRVVSVDGKRKVVAIEDGRELPCDLFLGVPKQGAPKVVVDAGITENGWVAVNPRTLETAHPDVYAVGDLANTGIPKAGVFAESAARAVARNVIDKIKNGVPTAKNPGKGSCYFEFGDGRVARVDVDFFSGQAPTGIFNEPSLELRGEKKDFGKTRAARWFGR